jgi:hypothetical protein
MRRGYKSELIKDEQGNLLGINLGSDYCAEHEWGIDGIKNHFGINIDSGERPFADWWNNLIGVKKLPLLGIEKRAITKCAELVFGEYQVSIKDNKNPKSKSIKHQIYYIGFKPYYYSPKEEGFENLIKSSIYSVGETENIWGWWSEVSFLIASTDKSAIEELHKALKEVDATISVGGGYVFKNGGLHFMIKSRISDDIVKEVYNQDLDFFNLKKAAVDTGIYDKLEKKDKKFYALSPRWKDEQKKEIVFWLNPEDQTNNNFGWYSIGDLEDWVKGVGKIPKHKEMQK